MRIRPFKGKDFASVSESDHSRIKTVSVSESDHSRIRTLQTEMSGSARWPWLDFVGYSAVFE